MNETTNETTNERVFPIDGEPTRFIVASFQPDTDPYLVDLGELSLNGQCACPHFDFRLRSQVESGRRPARCKHIALARDYYTDHHLLHDLYTKERGGAGLLRRLSCRACGWSAFTADPSGPCPGCGEALYDPTRKEAPCPARPVRRAPSGRRHLDRRR